MTQLLKPSSLSSSSFSSSLPLGECDDSHLGFSYAGSDRSEIFVLTAREEALAQLRDAASLFPSVIVQIDKTVADVLTLPPPPPPPPPSKRSVQGLSPSPAPSSGVISEDHLLASLVKEESSDGCGPLSASARQWQDRLLRAMPRSLREFPLPSSSWERDKPQSSLATTSEGGSPSRSPSRCGVRDGETLSPSDPTSTLKEKEMEEGEANGDVFFTVYMINVRLRRGGGGGGSGRQDRAPTSTTNEAVPCVHAVALADARPQQEEEEKEEREKKKNGEWNVLTSTASVTTTTATTTAKTGAQEGSNPSASCGKRTEREEVWRVALPLAWCNAVKRCSAMRGASADVGTRNGTDENIHTPTGDMDHSSSGVCCAGSDTIAIAALIGFNYQLGFCLVRQRAFCGVCGHAMYSAVGEGRDSGEPAASAVSASSDATLGVVSSRSGNIMKEHESLVAEAEEAEKRLVSFLLQDAPYRTFMVSHQAFESVLSLLLHYYEFI